MFGGYGIQEGNQFLGWGSDTFSRILTEMRTDKSLNQKLKTIGSHPDQEAFYFIFNLILMAIGFGISKDGVDINKGFKRAVNLGLGGVETLMVKNVGYLAKYAAQGNPE